MPNYNKKGSSRKTKKKGSSRNKNKKQYYKRGFNRSNFYTIKKIAQSVVSSPRNLEWKQMRASFELGNNSNVTGGDQYVNYRFIPLTALGKLNTLNAVDVFQSIRSKYQINCFTTTLKSTNPVNPDLNPSIDNRYGYIEGRRVSIHSIQIKGLLRFNNDAGQLKPGIFGFRIVRQYKQDMKDSITSIREAELRKYIPCISEVYKGIGTNKDIIENQGDIDRIRLVYSKTPDFNRKYQTLLKYYWRMPSTDNDDAYGQRKFNLLYRFKKPLEIRYDDGVKLEAFDTTDKMYLSLTNNLYFCPFFSQYYTGDDSGDDHYTQDIQATIVINYSDA